MYDKTAVVIDSRGIITRLVQCSNEPNIPLAAGESISYGVEGANVGYWVSEGNAHKRKDFSVLPTCDHLGNVVIIPECPLVLTIDHIPYNISEPATVILPISGAYQLHMYPTTGEYIERTIRVDY